MKSLSQIARDMINKAHKESVKTLDIGIVTNQGIEVKYTFEGELFINNEKMDRFAAIAKIMNLLGYGE
jgi:hypothetical protein